MKLKGIIHNVENRIRNGFKAVANSGYADGPAGYKKRVWQGFDFHSATPRADADDCVEKLRDRCRSVWYNSGLARNIVSIYGDWTLGNGLELKSESKSFRNEVEKAFNDWAISKRCDSRNDCDFFTLQRQIFDSLMINGEVFVIIHRFADDKGNVSINLEAVEGDAVRQPPVDVAKDRRIVSGIELNRYSEAVAYWFYNPENNKWSRIRRFDENGTKVIHLRRRERLGSVRGVPLIAPAIESIVQIERYSASELQTALLESCFSVVVKTDERIPESTLEQPIQPSPYSFDLGSGNINFIPTDSEIATIDGKRNQNATSLQQYVECITKTNVCSAVQIPFEILMSEFNSSYSASRASCLLFDRKATQVRDAFVLDFMNEVFCRVY